MPDDLDDLLGNDTSTGDGPAKGGGLRAQLEAVLAERQALKEQLSKLEGAQRQRDLDQLFEKHSIPAKAKGFFPKDQELNDKTAHAFLEEFGELWGHQQPAATTPPAEQEAAQRVQQVASQAPQTNLQPLSQDEYAARFAEATDMASLKSLMRDMGALSL